MNVRLTPDALQDLESIDSYISPENPEAATVTIRNIYESTQNLGRHPHVGRLGRLPGSRELVLPPYIVSYRIRRGVVEIHGIVHAARRWPR